MKKAIIMSLFVGMSLSLLAQTSSFNYTIRGIVPVIQQEGNTCWAAVSTMMLSWRRNQSLSVPSAMKLIGEPYGSIYTRGTQPDGSGLMAAEKPELLRRMKLVAEPPMNYTVQGFVTLFRQKAPLWVTTDEGNDWENPAIHARIITGIQGDGTVNGTLLTIIDPATGTTYQERFAVLAKKYERVVTTTGGLRAQIVHF